MSQPIRVLVVDDHPVVRTGVQAMPASNTDFDVVGEASDGDEALRQVGALHPDVVLMDLRMPGVDGVEATKRIRAQHPGVQVLVLTTYDTDEDIVRAIGAGAVGYHTGIALINYLVVGHLGLMHDTLSPRRLSARVRSRPVRRVGLARTRTRRRRRRRWVGACGAPQVTISSRRRPDRRLRR